MPSYGIIEKADDVTQIVLRAMAGAPNARLREVMAAFIQHLHAFAREVRLTQDEYDFAVDFLNRIGKATRDTHNEGMLFADAVGFSTLVVLMNNGGKGPTETAAALLGCVGILVHSTLDFNLQIPANAALFYVLCAIAASAPGRESQRRRVLRRHSLTIEPIAETPAT